MLDADFARRADALRVPGMGTEEMAPLLYHLVRFLRPRRVLEVGMGYTTLFLAKALADIRALVDGERRALAAKTEPYVRGDTPVDREWLLADPPLALPSFYEEDYRPRLVAIDSLAAEESSASDVPRLLAEAQLDDVVEVLNQPLATARPHLDPAATPFDFVWVDAWEALTFFDEWWDLVDPAGGIVAMHYLLTYPEGAAVLEFIKSTQAVDPRELELVSLLEPHKLAQNSVTIIRKTAEYVDPSYRLQRDDALSDETRARLAETFHQLTTAIEDPQP